MKNSIHLISYGDDKYTYSKQRLCNQAMDTKWFKTIKMLGKNDLSESFKKEFHDILCLGRGGGYWIWKYDIILQNLNLINDGEILIYLDAGCSINKNGESRLNEYIQLLQESGKNIISFQMHHIEKNFTTTKIFETFDVVENENITNTRHIMATVLIMRKDTRLIEMFEYILDKLRKDHFIITDKYNDFDKNNNKNFRDNRHDQSILSVVRKIYGSVILQDETYFENMNCDQAKNMPFLATRIRKRK